MNKPLAFLAILSPILFACRAESVIQGNNSLIIDFTKPTEAAKKASWTDPQTLQTEPVAVGWSWRTVYAVRMRAEVVPPGEYKIQNNSTALPPGQFFARYSPDRKHWSTWQALSCDQPPVDPAHPKQSYHGTLRVPESERAQYKDMLASYNGQDVPWKSDEEAAVKWMVEQQPDFFNKQLPFIGYVQFMVEVGREGRQKIEQLKFELDYGAGGLLSPPTNPDVFVSRDGPWRFEAK
ncbi:MAG: hypothetical protein HZB26_22545 [Candidatus Hydrogenedentes bacterium]|nr:hypothetical protein [Candidatus Hydrogenedentota bacterium]